jgi:hypothetical protein
MKNKRAKKMVNDYLEDRIEFLNSKKVKKLLKNYTRYMIKYVEDYILEQLGYSGDDDNDDNIIIDNVEKMDVQKNEK